MIERYASGLSEDKYKSVNSPVKNNTTLSDRGLNTGIPKPNIVRIEVLDGSARMRYLGGLQKIGDSFKTKIQNTTSKEDRIFFGFLKSDSNIELGFTNTWTDIAGAGNILGSIKASQKTARLGNTIQNIGDVVNKLTGMSVSSTGSSTLKQFANTDIKDFNVSCGWYLPEQLQLCNKSLRVLSRMMYPRQGTGSEVNDVSKQYDESIQEENKQNDNKNSSTVSAGDPGNSTFSKIANVVINNGQGVVQWLGGNITLDPLPVRVSIGQYVDIEPLLIESVRITMSKETFISESGRHLPLFCSVNISFKFWLRPRPELEFMSLFGTEMFGKYNQDPLILNKKTSGAGGSW